MFRKMKGDVGLLASRLAADRSYSDYDFWRALRTLNDELYRIERYRLPVPIDMVYARRVLREAMARRGAF